MNVNLQLAYDAKRLDDRQDATSTVSDKHIGVWTIGASGDRVDRLGGGGLSNWSIAYQTAPCIWMPTTSRWMPRVCRRRAATAKTAAQLARLQHLTDRLNLYRQADLPGGEQKPRHLRKNDPWRRFGVRAYPQGEAPSDDALLTNLELRYSLTRLGTDWFRRCRKGNISHRRLPGQHDNRRSLSGVGLGLSWSRTADCLLQSFLAWRTDRRANRRGWIAPRGRGFNL